MTATTKPVDVLRVLEDCGAYVDDAAQFPEQFKPGVVKRHQRQYAEASAAIAELIEAATLCCRHGGTEVVTAGVAAARVKRLRTALAAIQGENVGGDK